MWINNCIGSRNYRYFFLMICTAFTYLLVFTASVAVLWRQANWGEFVAAMVFNWICSLLTLVFSLLLLLLIGLHCYLSYLGLTTFDYIISKREKSRVIPIREVSNTTENAAVANNKVINVATDEIIFRHPDILTAHERTSENSFEPEKSQDVIKASGQAAQPQQKDSL